MPIELIHNPDRTLYSVLSGLLADTAMTRMRAAVSYVQLSGSVLLYEELLRFRERGGKASLVCAVDQSITTYEGLLTLVESGVELFVYRAASHGFHPKAWLWYEGMTGTASVVGSGNLTRGGLVRNVEVADYVHGQDADTIAYLAKLEAAIQQLEVASRRVLTKADLDQAAVDFSIPHEKAGRRALQTAGGSVRSSTPGVVPAATPPMSQAAKELVRRLVGAVAPPLERSEIQSPVWPVEPVDANAPLPLSPTDVAGVEVDQVLVEANPLRRPRTPGELRLALPSLFLAPLFWGWPDSFARSTLRGSDYWERFSVCRFHSAG